MSEKFKSEPNRKNLDTNHDFQGEYMPESVTLDQLRERMRSVAGKE